MGRATSVDRLQIVNFKSSNVCEHEQSVYANFKTCTLRNLNPDKSFCHGKTCKGNIVGTNNEDDIAGGGENDNDDDDEDDEDDEPQTGRGHSTGCICCRYCTIPYIKRILIFWSTKTCYY